MRAPGRLVLWFLAAGLGALGLLMRLFLLWHKSINSDEAVVGLMARDILHGHFSAFYWGQDYGGVEPYVTAALFGLFGQNDVTLNLAPVVLSAVSSVLVWRIARYVLAEPVAVLVGLATWVWPVAVVVYSAQESGFRYATLTLGLAAVLFATQIRSRGSTWPRWLCFGLAIGACVWSSPESVYFVVPCALLAIPALLSSRTVRSVAAHLGTFLAGALVGALPLLWVVVRSGLGVIVNPTGATYPGSTARSRLSAFVKHSGPIATGSQRPLTGTWLGGVPLGPVILGAIVVATVIGFVLAMRRRPEYLKTAIPIASFVVLYPVFYVLFDPTIFWNDGRYVVYLPYVAIISAGFVSWLIRSPSVRVAAAAAVVILAAAATVYELPQVVPGFSAGDLTHPLSGSRQSLAALAGDLRGKHVTIGYAGYWVAYDLDFEGRGSLRYTPSPPGVVRNQGYLLAADASAHPAWIVCPPDHAAECQRLLGHTSVDPQGVTETSLEAWLGSHHVRFTVVPSEGFEAVVPDARVTPAMLGA
jgi:hypothetical protein